jgi:hypothetical protein
MREASAHDLSRKILEITGTAGEQRFHPGGSVKHAADTPADLPAGLSWSQA